MDMSKLMKKAGDAMEEEAIKEREKEIAEKEEAERLLEEKQKELARERENPDQIDVAEMKEWTEAELDYLERRIRATPADVGVALDRWVLIAHSPTPAPPPPLDPNADPAAPPPPEPPPIPSPIIHRSLMEVWAAVPLVHARVMDKRGHEIWRNSDQERLRKRIEEIATEAHTPEDAREMSRKERADEMFLDEYWSYGEVDLGVFAGILMKLKRIHGHLGKEGIGTFVDCGCGLGKTVLAAVLCHSWEKAAGIEGLQTLVDGATVLLERFQETVYPTLSDKEQDARQDMELSVTHDDFFADDSWLAGTCVFVDLTCFNPELVRRFADFSQELSHGSVVISLSKRLDFAVHLFLLFEEEAECSWGATHVHVYERKPNPEELERFLNPPDPSDI
ncbi:histone methylation protein DOT1 [Aureococcus anophagefferens]|nr:histone methylation protein DOT1 [Aureococcus anophagefferens]